MITDLLLATTLGLGQMPMPGSATPVASYPNPSGGMVLVMQPGTAPVAPPAKMPMGTVPMGSPMPMGVTPMPMGTVPMGSGPMGEPTQVDPGTTEKADEGEPETKYFVMKTLEGSWLGDKLGSSGINIFGWTEATYTASSTRYTNLPVTTNDWANELLLQQNYLVIEKAIDTSKKEVQFGFRTDWVLPGSDYRFTLPRGLWNNQLTSGSDGGPELYGVDLFQSYVDLFLPGIGEGTTVRAGRFATIIGYELVQAVDTPFVSRSYNFQYNPYTHCGVLATTALNDTWSVANGFVLGADNYFGSQTGRFNYLGQVKWAPPEGDTSVLFNTMITDPRFQQDENFTQFNCYNFLITQKLSDSLTYVLDATASHTYDVPDVGTAWWYGFANYLIKSHNDCVSSTFRLEFFDDVRGFRTGSEGLYTAATYGLAWTPTDALLIRPGVRYDHNNTSTPFEDKSNMFTAWLDVIWRW